MAMSSLRLAASISSSEVRVSDWRWRSMSSAVKSKSRPPATLKAARLTPRRSKTTLPPRAKKVTTKKKIVVALRAAFRRFSGESRRVSARKIGASPRGSTTKKSAESETKKKLADSTSIGDHDCRSAGGREDALCQPGEDLGRGAIAESGPPQLRAQGREGPQHRFPRTAFGEQGRERAGQGLGPERCLKKLRDGRFTQKDVDDASVGEADQAASHEDGDRMRPVDHDLRAKRQGRLQRGRSRADRGGVGSPQHLRGPAFEDLHLQRGMPGERGLDGRAEARMRQRKSKADAGKFACEDLRRAEEIAENSANLRRSRARQQRHEPPLPRKAEAAPARMPIGARGQDRVGEEEIADVARRDPAAREPLLLEGIDAKQRVEIAEHPD